MPAHVQSGWRMGEGLSRIGLMGEKVSKCRAAKHSGNSDEQIKCQANTNTAWELIERTLDYLITDKMPQVEA